MYFSQCKTAPSSINTVNSSTSASLPTKKTTTLQKNLFNLNIYTADKSTSPNFSNEHTHTFSPNSTKSSSDQPQLIRYSHSHNKSLHSSSHKSQYSIIPAHPKGQVIQQPHSQHKTSPFNLLNSHNSNTAQNNYQLTQSSTNNLSDQHRRQQQPQQQPQQLLLPPPLPIIKLVGYKGDPQFQQTKERSKITMQINSNICILTIDEIDNETDYDIRLKTMKRVSSFFLPAYQSFKTNKLATSSSFKVNQTPHSKPGCSLKRPFFFITEQNEPFFSLKDLTDRFSLTTPSTKSYLINPNDFTLPSLEQQQSTNYSESHLHSQTTTLKKTYSKTLVNLPQQLNIKTPDFPEKKHVYLTLRTSLKHSNPEYSSLPLFQNVQSLQQLSISDVRIPSFVGDIHDDCYSTSTCSQVQSTTSLHKTTQLYNKGDQFHLIIELYTKVAPKACENFMKLCEGHITSEGDYLTFRNTQALRLKKNGFIQMGYSKPGVSIFNGYFEDESFAVPHDKPGILGYCNRGVPHSNSSQFYITLAAMKSFDKKMVAFGRVINGFEHIEKIHKQMITIESEIPPINILICDSGVIQNNNNNISRKNTHLLSPLETLTADTHRVVRPDVFTYKGEKQIKFQTYESYVIGEAAKHKDVAITEYIQLMLTFQSIAFACSQIVLLPHMYSDVHTMREAMKKVFVNNLSACSAVALFYDIKGDEVFIESHSGKFVVAFTCLDIDYLHDVSSCGSLFIIFKKTTTSFRPAQKSDLFQNGDAIYGAGYIMYGQSTQIVFHTGYRLNGFTCDNENNVFVLTHPRIKCSKKGGIISCDESQLYLADQNVQKFIRRKKINKESYVTRYCGSRVADFHRTLIYGGILIYPEKNVNIYEALILGYIIEKAWDRSSCGQDGQILIKKPVNLTDSVQLYLGFSQDILELDNLYLSIRRKNSLYQIHPLPSIQNNLKSSSSSSSHPLHKSSQVSSTKIH